MNEASVRLKPLLGLLAVLVLGILLGALITWNYLVRKMNDFDRRDPNAPAAFITNNLNDELRLTVSQQETIHTILQSRIQELRAIHKQIDPQLMEIRTGLQKQIRDELTEEQRKKFDLLLTQYRRPFLPITGPPPLNDSAVK